MKHTFEVLKHWMSIANVSGNEAGLKKEDLSFSPMFQNAVIDSWGNILVAYPSNHAGAKNVLIEAHRDRIGLCIRKILPGGFLSVVPCGGFDPTIVPGTEFLFFGKKTVRAIACSIPPHLLNKTDDKEKLSFSDLYFDTGLSCANEFLSVGDFGCYAAPIRPLSSSCIAASGLDNLASVASLQIAWESLKTSKNNIYFLFSSGEETGHQGIKNALLPDKIDLAVVVDVGFANSPGLSATNVIEIGKGPSLSFSDTLSNSATKEALRLAKEKDFQVQVIAEPGSTGTNAMALSLLQGGIPCVLVSIPLANMHTQSEIISLLDVAKTGELLSTVAQEFNGMSLEV